MQSDWARREVLGGAKSLHIMNASGGKQRPVLRLKALPKKKRRLVKFSADNGFDEEDLEIKRLEKLLGVRESGKNKAAAKLNKEFEEFEGIGENFGDFLMSLDNLTESITGKQTTTDSTLPPAVNEVEEDVKLYDDEVSQVDEDAASNQESTENSTDEDGEEYEEELPTPAETYQPTEGEDIYGRVIGSSAQKYTPPARRKELVSAIDESSDTVRLLRRTFNGFMNKLSDESKDSIIRSLKQLFDSNSITVCSFILRDCIMAACANPTQLMSSLIPIFSAVIAALHFTVGIEVGAFIIESLAVSLNQAILNSITTDHSLISSKLPSNSLLLLVYLYNLRILHHTLIVDIMTILADCSKDTTNGNGPSLLSGKDTGADETMLSELRVELLEVIINHCGPSIRSDDPVSLKLVVSTLNKRLGSYSAGMSSEGTGASGMSNRLRFMFEALTDLKNNKSRRVQTANADAVKKLRKWLGSIKSSLPRNSGAAIGDPCLRVSLRDLLDADKRGRWWRAGASWVGNDAKNSEHDSNNEGEQKAGGQPDPNSEEQQLLLLAQKCRMNTATRRKIFCVLMSSRDVLDAFERLARLGLKGKEDREMVRVLMECCGQERTYNPFYAELAKMFCTQNRQFKTTFQFAFWDNFKLIQVFMFHVPLAVIKVIDMGEMSEGTVAFLTAFFATLFTRKASEEDYQNVLDRVATTKDFALAMGGRDAILPNEDMYEVEKTAVHRRKVAIRTMEAMSVLDISQGCMDEEEDV
eukprot:gene32648-42283_t